MISKDNCSILVYLEGIDIYHNSFKFWVNNDPNLGSLEHLQSILRIRQKSHDHSSYTFKLLFDPMKIKTKLQEEANELVCSETNQEIIHEAADLFYFLTLNSQYYDVSIRDVEEFYFTNFYKHKDTLVTTNTSLTLKIAICDSLEQDMIEEQIKSFGIEEENATLFELFSNNYMIKFIRVSPFDIYNLILRKSVDSAVCFEYEIEEFLSEFHSFSLNHPSVSSLVILSKTIKNLEELKEINRKRRIILMTSLLKIANKWIRKHNLKVKVVSISDNHSTYLEENMCDIILIPNNYLTNTEGFYLIEVYSKYEKKMYVDINKLHILNTIQSKK
jgi:phosphoribosyl-ATP pyrophosphohydrolase